MAKPFRLVLSESNEAFGQMLSYYLEKEGWEVTVFGSNTFFLTCVADCPDLWILDADGEEWVKLMREIQKSSAQIPIILTSKREKFINRVWGFELGCADFIVKPFMPKELVYRVRKILDKCRAGSVEKPEPGVVKLQAYHLDFRRRIVLFNDAAIDLTCKEFDILWLFSRHSGIALSREQILNSVWGENYFGSDRVVDDLVRRVRRKLTTLKIETVFGYGYRIVL